RLWGRRIRGKAFSGGQRERGARDLLVQASGSIGFAITQRRIADSGQLVGERAGGSVVIGAELNGQSPLPQAIDGLAGTNRDAGGAQHGARAVSEQHAQIAVAAFGDASEVAGAARRMLFGREAEPGGEVPRIVKVADVARSRGNHGGGGGEAGAR